MALKCPTCGHKVPPAAANCPGCGRIFAKTDAPVRLSTATAEEAAPPAAVASEEAAVGPRSPLPIVMLLLGLSTAVGAFLPWVKFGGLTMSGMQRDPGSAIAVLVGAGIAVLASAAWISGLLKLGRVLGGAALLGGLVAGGAGIINFVGRYELFASSSYSQTCTPAIGLGVYVTGLGGLALTGVGLWILTLSKRTK